MTFKKKANKEIKDEVRELLLEKEEMRQRRLEAEAEMAKEYEEDFRREKEREEDEWLASQEDYPYPFGIPDDQDGY